MGSTGDSPVPVGDPPTGTSLTAPSNRSSSLAGDALFVPSGESPDGTGQWPVLPILQADAEQMFVSADEKLALADGG